MDKRKKKPNPRDFVSYMFAFSSIFFFVQTFKYLLNAYIEIMMYYFFEILIKMMVKYMLSFDILDPHCAGTGGLKQLIMFSFIIGYIF